MRVMVLGATGATGAQIVDQALAGGFDVTAYVRSPEKILRQDPRLRVVPGLLSEPDKLHNALKGHDAVLCALGHSRLFDPTPVITDAIRLLLKGMRAHGVRRLIYESAYRAGAEPGDLGLFFDWVLKPFLLKHVFADHQTAEAEIAAGGIEWVIARPGILTNGPLTGRYRVQEVFGRETVRISRADTAHFMVRQVTEPDYVGRMMALGY